jgi:thiol-disulfide isomerase/thioredoxin
VGSAWARPGAAAVALAFSIGACAHNPQLPTLNAFAPALQLRAIGSVPYLYSNLPGRVILVNFLATWCFPCIGQLPLLKQAQERYAPRGFTVVAVGMDLEGAEVLEPFAREYQLNFPLLLADERIRQGQTAFGTISSLPATLLFGRDGRLITVFAGLLVPAELDALISQAVAESQPKR